MEERAFHSVGRLLHLEIQLVEAGERAAACHSGRMVEEMAAACH